MAYDKKCKGFYAHDCITKTWDNVFFPRIYLGHQAIHKWNLNMSCHVSITKTVAYSE